MQYLRFFRTLVFVGSVFISISTSAHAMSDQEFITKYSTDFSKVNSNRQNEKEFQRFTTREVLEASLEFLTLLADWPENFGEKPRALFKAAGRGFGQISFLAPWNIHSSSIPFEGGWISPDAVIAKYLKSGELQHSDIATHYWKFKFGQITAPSQVSLDDLTRMPNGQEIMVKSHLNLPVYFNRTVSEFEGDSLLVGGGQNCGCGEAATRHPSEYFYSIDIDNSHKPDMVIHSGYLEHLHALPSGRFKFIWVEHSTIAELVHEDLEVLSQYFRIMAPGGIILFQTNFVLDGPDMLEIFNKSVENIRKNMAALKIQTTQPNLRQSKRFKRYLEYIEFVAVKPFLNEGAAEIFQSPKQKIDTSHYRMANSTEVVFAEIWSKIYSNQKQLQLMLPFDKLMEKVRQAEESERKCQEIDATCAPNQEKQMDCQVKSKVEG